MKQCVKKAENMEKDPEKDFLKSIEYRKKMARQWSKIIINQKTTEKVSIEQIYDGMTDEDVGDDLSDVRKNTQTRLGTTLVQKQNRIDENIRQQNNPENTHEDTRSAAESDDLSLAA